MATETTNYKLKKPEYNEYVDIGALNENFDILDEKLKEIEEATEIKVDVTADVPMHLSVTASGGLRITYDDGN